jgi:hypothetical protein
MAKAPLSAENLIKEARDEETETTGYNFTGAGLSPIQKR